MSLQDVFFALYPYTFLRTKPKVKVVNWGGVGGFEVDKVKTGAFNFLVYHIVLIDMLDFKKTILQLICKRTLVYSMLTVYLTANFSQ